MSKKELKKVTEEVEEVSKKVAEEVPEEVQEVAEEVEQENKAKFINAEKLKCNFEVYKRERIKLKMNITEKCTKCGKKFKDSDELYSAYKENDKTGKKHLICKNCAKG